MSKPVIPPGSLAIVLTFFVFLFSFLKYRGKLEKLIQKDFSQEVREIESSFSVQEATIIDIATKVKLCLRADRKNFLRHLSIKALILLVVITISMLSLFILFYWYNFLPFFQELLQNVGMIAFVVSILIGVYVVCFSLKLIKFQEEK